MFVVEKWSFYDERVGSGELYGPFETEHAARSWIERQRLRLSSSWRFSVKELRDPEKIEEQSPTVPPPPPTRPAYFPWNMPKEDDCRCCGCRRNGHHPHGCEGVGGNCGCSLGDYRPRGKEANDLRLARADIYDANRRLVRRATEEG